MECIHRSFSFTTVSATAAYTTCLHLLPDLVRAGLAPVALYILLGTALGRQEAGPRCEGRKDGSLEIDGKRGLRVARHLGWGLAV